ncbi:MAG: hypothetical protein IPI66_08715 [Chitinophagaceae bacterium]|nr:hypothetical protein [Chitinophagaceae bacterium]
MKKTSRLSLLLVGGLLFASVTFVACNSGEEKKEAPKTDSPAVAPVKVDSPAVAPAKVDSPAVMDKANTKPTPTPNQ